MQHIVEATSAPQQCRADENEGVTFLPHEAWRRHAPSAHYHLLRDNHLAARCSIWSESTPHYLGIPTGVIGHYAAVDATASTALLKHAMEQLRLRGITSVIGPMDGNTWRHYRLLSHRGREPIFFLEPDNPDDWPHHFTAAGFTPLAQYYSALNDDLSISDPRVPQAAQRMRNAGIVIRQIDLARFEEELKAVHELSVTSFAGNFLYTPISEDEFLAMYAPVKSHVRPELVLLAQLHSQLVGFVFGVPDLLQARRGERVTTVIAKTLAVRPGRTAAGLGCVLIDQFQQAARQMGFTRVIHALMHQDNTSRKISARYGKSIRQYTLYTKDLSQ